MEHLRDAAGGGEKLQMSELYGTIPAYRSRLLGVGSGVASRTDSGACPKRQPSVIIRGKARFGMGPGLIVGNATSYRARFAFAGVNAVPRLTQEVLNEFVAGIRQTVDEEARVLAELKVREQTTKDNTRDALASYARGLKPYLTDNAEMQRRVIAYLYWQVEKLPVGWICDLFQVHEVLTIARELQYHGLKCSICGGTVDFTSRTDLPPLRKRSTLECKSCRDARFAEQNKAGQAYWDAQRQRRQELHTMPYKQYLLSEEWQQTRQRKLKRARYACELCGKPGKLNVHHKTYERRGYEDDKDLIVLCGTCHAKFHDKLPEAE